MATNKQANDKFENPIVIGDTVAAVGTRYKDLYLYKVVGISNKKVRLEALEQIPSREPTKRNAWHSQCVVKFERLLR